jgi:hypothetical protein
MTKERREQARNAVRRAIEGGAVLTHTSEYLDRYNQPKKWTSTVGPYRTATGGDKPQYASYCGNYREYEGTSAYRAAANFVSIVGVPAAEASIKAIEENK